MEAAGGLAEEKPAEPDESGRSFDPAHAGASRSPGNTTSRSKIRRSARSRSTPAHQSVSATIETKSDWEPLVHFLYDAQTPGGLHRFRKRQLDDRQRLTRQSCAGGSRSPNGSAPAGTNHECKQTPHWPRQWTLLCLTNPGWRKTICRRQQKFSRYEPMVKHSPFAVATAGAPIPCAPDFAKDLYVANAAHSTDGDFVTIASTTDKNFKEYLTTKETVDGYSVSEHSMVGQGRRNQGHDHEGRAVRHPELQRSGSQPGDSKSGADRGPAAAASRRSGPGSHGESAGADSAADGGPADSDAAAAHAPDHSAQRHPANSGATGPASAAGALGRRSGFRETVRRRRRSRLEILPRLDRVSPYRRRVPRRGGTKAGAL